jgi:citrate lyase beta subunit
MSVPADEPDRFVKALSYRANAIFVDIAGPDHPLNAREVAAAFVAPTDSGADIWVRTNPGPFGSRRRPVGCGRGPA